MEAHAARVVAVPPRVLDLGRGVMLTAAAAAAAAVAAVAEEVNPSTACRSAVLTQATRCRRTSSMHVTLVSILLPPCPWQVQRNGAILRILCSLEISADWYQKTNIRWTRVDSSILARTVVHDNVLVPQPASNLNVKAGLLGV